MYPLKNILQGIKSSISTYLLRSKSIPFEGLMGVQFVSVTKVPLAKIVPQHATDGK